MLTQEITLFKTKEDVTHPAHATLGLVIERIRDSKYKTLIEDLRLGLVPKERKGELPVIVFSGKFSKRNNASLIQHSGLVCIDIDDIKGSVEQVKETVSKFSWVVCCFVSPSGNGLKVICATPHEPKRHKGYFFGIIKEFKELELDAKLDNTPDLSRACFESYDPMVYVNEAYTVFDKHIDVKTIKELEDKLVQDVREEVLRGVGYAIDSVKRMEKGKRNEGLCSKGTLLGGFVGGGFLGREQAIDMMCTAVKDGWGQCSEKDIKTITSAIENGSKMPITAGAIKGHIEQIDIERRAELNAMVEEALMPFDEMDDYLDMVKEGRLQMGLPTGWSELDNYFRFKRRSFVVVNGHDNVGKSTVLLYLAVLSAHKHGWRWILYCGENDSGEVYNILIEHKVGVGLAFMTDKEYSDGKRWVYEHFKVIRNDKMYSAHELMNTIEAVKIVHGDFDACLVDPYNSLYFDMEQGGKSSHEIHYDIASAMRIFIDKHDMSMYLNCHVVTTAGRTVHKDGIIQFNGEDCEIKGMQVPPGKADTEGGGKFANKADQFLTIHRYVAHERLRYVTEVHVRKERRTNTGGGITPMDKPFRMMMKGGEYRGFFNLLGHSPIHDVLPPLITPVVSEPSALVRDYTESDREDDVPDYGDAPF